MPNNHRGRPPGRREDCRPGKGPALVPQPSKHRTVLAAVPTAQAFLDELQAAGSPQDTVDAVRLCVDYARERAEQGVAKSARDTSSKPNQLVNVPIVFRDHVYASADDSTAVATVVNSSLEDFVEGDWTPPAPQRAQRGRKLPSTNINVRVSSELWDAANALGKDPEQVAARGYKLTAVQVAIAALVETFGRPESMTEQSSTTA